MTDLANPGQFNGRLGLRPQALRDKPRFAVSRRAVADKLLYFVAYFCLLRATGMWIGYPPTQDENATVDSMPQQLMLYSLIPLTLAYVFLQPKTVAGYLRHIPLVVLLFSALVLISTFTSVDVVASTRGLAAVVVISLPILLFKFRFGSVKTIEMMRNFAAVSIVANLLYTAITPSHGIMQGSLAGSVRGMFLHKNFFGQFSAVAFLLLVPSLTDRPLFTRRNVIMAGCCFLALLSAAVSKSSTALVLSMVGLMSLMMSWILANVLPVKPIRAYVLIAGLILITGFVYFFGLAVAGDIAGLFGKDITLSGRGELWDALLDALFERPWFGHGFAMFRQPDYIAIFTHAVAWGPRSTHNTYLEMALNIGIPGAVLWAAFLLSRYIRKAVNIPRDPVERFAGAKEVAVMLMIMAGSFTEAGMMLAPLATWPLLLAVLPDGYRSKRKAVRPPMRAEPQSVRSALRPI